MVTSVFPKETAVQTSQTSFPILLSFIADEDFFPLFHETSLALTFDITGKSEYVNTGKEVVSFIPLRSFQGRFGNISSKITFEEGAVYSAKLINQGNIFKRYYKDGVELSYEDGANKTGNISLIREVEL